MQQEPFVLLKDESEELHEDFYERELDFWLVEVQVLCNAHDLLAFDQTGENRLVLFGAGECVLRDLQQLLHKPTLGFSVRVDEFIDSEHPRLPADVRAEPRPRLRCIVNQLDKRVVELRLLRQGGVEQSAELNEALLNNRFNHKIRKPLCHGGSEHSEKQGFFIEGVLRGYNDALLVVSDDFWQRKVRQRAFIRLPEIAKQALLEVDDFSGPHVGRASCQQEIVHAFFRDVRGWLFKGYEVREQLPEAGEIGSAL